MLCVLAPPALHRQAAIGGKGSVRRKKKAVHKAAAADDKKLQATLKRLGVNNLPSIEEVRAPCVIAVTRVLCMRVSVPWAWVCADMPWMSACVYLGGGGRG